MGNNIAELIQKELEEIKILISNHDYENSYNRYKELHNKLVNKNSEEGLIYLLNYGTNPKNKLLFSTIIGNLKKEDKISYLFHLIYEQFLIGSIDYETEESDKNSNMALQTILNDRQREKRKNSK